jgi:phosphoribosyl 1,2-cyclic phosphate phosphodiesterase
VDRVDAVLYTHDHADHTHGIDDLRAITVRRDTPLPIYGSAETLGNLAAKFRYIFDDAIRPLPGTSKPQGSAHVVEPGVPFMVGDLVITPVEVPHGTVTVFAYRIGPLAYITDSKAIPPAALRLLTGARVLVINALFHTEHPTHLSFPEAIAAARAIGAERTFLTHLTHDNFHADLEAELPHDMVPAFDGLTVRIDEEPDSLSPTSPAGGERP